MRKLRAAAFAAFLVLTLSAGVAAWAAANPVFVGNKNSKKFHRATCRFAKGMKAENRVEFPSAAAAEEAGFIPCKVCKPAGRKRPIPATRK